MARRGRGSKFGNEGEGFWGESGGYNEMIGEGVEVIGRSGVQNVVGLVIRVAGGAKQRRWE